MAEPGSDLAPTVRLLWLLRQAFTQGTDDYDVTQDLHVHLIPESFPAADMKELADAGLAPNSSFVRLGHDETLAGLRALTAGWTLADAAGAFVASLWSAPFLWRSALPAKAIMAVMPEHGLEPYSASASKICGVCGFHPQVQDTARQWLFRMTEGTPLDGQPGGYLLALRDMSSLDRPQPNGYDRWTFRAVLTVLRRLPPKTRYSKAVLALKQARLLPSTSPYAYRSVLEVLALMGVLDTPGHPGMAARFTTYRERDRRPRGNTEVQAPLAWWDSSAGVNETALAALFPGVDTSPADLAGRPEPDPPLAGTVTGALAKLRPRRAAAPRTPATAGHGPAQAGDVYAVRVRDGQ